MQIGIIALTLLFALGAVGLGLFTVRSSRMLINTTLVAPFFDFAITSVFAVAALLCGIGAVHFFNQIGG